MNAKQTGPTVWVHLDSRCAGSLTAPPDAPAVEWLPRVQAFLDSVTDRAASICILVPNSLQSTPFHWVFEDGSKVRTIGYGDETHLVPPEPPRKGRVWIVNGRQAPVGDFPPPRPSGGDNSDILVFASGLATYPDHYPESVNVDATGQVLGFRRHYHDSPLHVERRPPEAAMLCVRSEQARLVLAHLVVHGWQTESIGGLTRRMSVRWAEDPGTPVPTRMRESRAATASKNRERAPGVTPIPQTQRDGRPRELAAGSNPGADDRSSPGHGVVTNRDGSHADHPAIIDADAFATSSDDRRAVAGRRLAFSIAKRTMDILVAAGGLLLFSPILLVVAALVKLTSRGPIFFSHVRQGMGGREFRCLKFRTMTLGAHEMQQELRDLNEVDGPQFKIADDPRLTGIGYWLRRFNVDEVPQLWNVLRGEMSLVGPRPSPDGENQLCPAWRRGRLSVRPGLTGLWQVLRRREDPDRDFQEWIYYDLEYVKHRSPWLDWQIFWATPVSMFAPRRLPAWLARIQRRGVCRHAADMGWTLAAEPPHPSQAVP